MLDTVQIKMARDSGILFVCAMCVKWHKGSGVLKNRHGGGKCMSTSCKSIIGGGDFGDYEGPLDSNLARFCHMCGEGDPEHVLEPKVNDSQRIGCCSKCLVTLKGMAVEPDRGPGRRVLWTTEKVVGPEKFEVVR